MEPGAGFEPAKSDETFRKSFIEKEAILKEFRDYIEIDLARAKKTADRHVANIKRLLDSMGEKSPALIEPADIREFLKSYKNGNLSSYENAVKSVRVFTRFLGLEDLGKRFKFPRIPFQPRRVPSDKEVRRMFYGFDNLDDKALYLTLASSGLRYGEAVNLTREDINFETGMVLPKSRSVVKSAHITFVNSEALDAIAELPDDWTPIFGKHYKSKDRYRWQIARERTGTWIRPKDLRVWFADKMGRLGVPDRYIDAFCGRVPASVLARHYTDYSPQKLKEIYDAAGLRVLK